MGCKEVENEWGAKAWRKKQLEGCK